jgi:phosphopantetheinyl transferase (holo-ACP synthase)
MTCAAWGPAVGARSRAGEMRGMCAMSTGNDIVALHAIDGQRTLQPRFYSKILSPSEQALYDRYKFSGLPFEHFVWLLWSVKESVYKYCQRIGPGLVFSPTRIVIHQMDIPSHPLSGFYRCTVHFDARVDARVFYSRSVIREEWIATVVSDEETFEDVWWGVAAIDHAGHAAQSAAVRSVVLGRLGSLLQQTEGGGDRGGRSCSEDPEDRRSANGRDGSGDPGGPGGQDGLCIGKSPKGYPVILRGNQEMGIPVSLAHHDRFVAYSFRLPTAPLPADLPGVLFDEIFPTA